ncbi:MAG: hypothetical protein MUE30_16455 [Spirosomaceae bacterium]|jgi:hypothetical protein|nr:hypothetical protein [Spirosomataceae bacterium]
MNPTFFFVKRPFIWLLKWNSIGLLFLLGLLSCNTEIDTDTPTAGAPPFSGEGYRPIYMGKTEIQKISTTAPQPLRKPGKIYVRGSYLFINEQGKGIHLLNNADPRNPQKISFINIPGNVDIAVKGNLLYADNGRDFVVLDIGNPADIQVVKRIENAFPIQQNPPYIGYFECVDEAKGVVVGWEKVKMSRPRCYR